MNERPQQKMGTETVFDPLKFRKGLMTTMIPVMLGAVVLGLVAMVIVVLRAGAPFTIATVSRALMADGPVIVAPVAIGGFAIGLFAVGGVAIGLIAVGGGAIGVIAIGGGAIGIFAFGGGAVGWVAIGGGALGRHVLGGDGWGPSVLSYKRQDRTAAEFFCRWLPRLRPAFPQGTAALERNRSGWHRPIQ